MKEGRKEEGRERGSGGRGRKKEETRSTWLSRTILVWEACWPSDIWLRFKKAGDGGEIVANIAQFFYKWYSHESLQTCYWVQPNYFSSWYFRSLSSFRVGNRVSLGTRYEMNCPSGERHRSPENTLCSTSAVLGSWFCFILFDLEDVLLLSSC